MKTFESVLVTGHLSAVVGGRSLGPHGEFGRSQLLPVCLLLFAASLSLSLFSPCFSLIFFLPLKPQSDSVWDAKIFGVGFFFVLFFFCPSFQFSKRQFLVITILKVKEMLLVSN